MTPATSRQPWPRLVLLGVFVALLLAFLLSGGARYLTLDAVKQNAATLRTFTEAHYVEALFLAFAVYLTATTLSLPSGTLLSLTFGFLFGRWIASDLQRNSPRKRFELPLVQTGLKLRIWERERRSRGDTMSRSETSRRALRRFLVGAAIGLTVVVLFGAALA